MHGFHWGCAYEEKDIFEAFTANNRFAPVCLLRGHFRKMFSRRLYNLCIGLTKPYQHVRISPEARKDLLTWKLFLSYFNGTAIFKYDPWVSDECLHLFTDASGLGYGAVFGAHWFFGEWPLKWKTKPISFLELFPIVISIHLWSPHLRHKHIIIHTDNQALIHVINNSTSKNANMMALVRTLVITCMQFNVQIYAKHILGKSNTLADLLSRLVIFTDCQVPRTGTWVRSTPNPCYHRTSPSPNSSGTAFTGTNYN